MHETDLNVNDSYNLQRFLDAQEGVIDRVYRELQQGQKRTHWMWFIFPQVAGFGYSPISQKFAISSRKEAEAYLEHTVLGGRLRRCTDLVNNLQNRSALQIFGEIDALKFRSSMTLFSLITPYNESFRSALSQYFDGLPDPRTLAALNALGE